MYTQETDPEIRYFGYEISAELYGRTAATLNEIRSGGDARQLSRQAAQNLVDITREGFEAYYKRPAGMIEISPMVRKAADTGVAAVMKTIDMVIHKLMAKRSLEDLQRLSVDMGQMICASTGSDCRFYVCYPLSHNLYASSQNLLARVQKDPDVDAYRDDIIQSLEGLIEEGILNYYAKPVSKADIGRITRAAADVGMSTVKKGSSMVVHKVFKSMSHTTLLPLAAYFRTLLHDEMAPLFQPSA